MASRHDIIHIDFEANAGKVSPALKAIQNSAADTRKAVQEVEQELANLEKAGADGTAIEAKKKQLRDLNREVKSLDQAEREYVKGIGTLDKAIKAFNDGTLSQMSAAFQKASYNAAKLAQTKLVPSDKDYKKSMEELNALMQRNMENMAKARMQTDDLLKTIEGGGKVAATWLRQEKQNLEELLDVIPRGTAEWKQYNDQLTKIKDYTQTLSETERRLAGEIVDANDARRMANQLTKEGAEAAAREREAAETTIAAQEKKIAGMEEERQERLKSAQALSKQVADEANEIELKKQTIAELEKQVAAEKAAAESTQKSTEAQKASEEAQAAALARVTEAETLYNQKLEQRIQKEKELDAIKYRSHLDDPEIKRLETEIEKLKELIAVTDKYKKQFTKMSDQRFETDYMGDDAEVKKDYLLKLDPRKSVWGAADYLRGAYSDRVGASLVDYAKAQDPSDQYGYVAKYETAAKRVANGVVENAQENLRRAILREIQDGNFTPEFMEEQIESFRGKMHKAARDAGEGNLKNDPEYNAYKYIVAQMEKYVEVARQVQAEREKIAGSGDFLELARHKDNIDAPHEGLLWQKEKHQWDRYVTKTDEIERRRKEDERVKSEEVRKAKEEEAEAERKLNEEKKKATEQTQAATQATKQSSETTSEATKKLQEERAALNSMESAHEGNIKKLQEEQQAISKVDEAIQQETQVMQEAEVKKAQNQELTVKRMEEIVAMLEKENRETIPANSKQWTENKAVIDELTEAIKVAKGEWMSYDEAAKLAGQVGTDDFITTQQKLQMAMAAVQREIDKTKLSLHDLNSEENKNQKAIDEEKAKLEQLEKQFKDLKFEQDNFNMSHERMQNLLKEPKSTRDLDELRAAIKRADGELHRMQDSLGTNKEAAEDFAKQIKEAKIALGQLESQSKASASSFEKAWSRLKTYISLYVGAAVAMQKVAATMGDLMELSDKMGEVRKTTGWSADEVGRLSDNLKRLDVRTSLVQLLDLSAAAGQLGLKTQEAVEGFTKSANMLMVALPEMGREAATSLMKIADATGDLEKNGGNVEETLQRVGSTIIALRANSASAAPAITDFVSRVGAVGAQAGISIDQIAAMGSTIDALGGRVEMSATALSRMIPAIRNNSYAIANSIGVTESYLKSLSAMDQMVLIFQKLRDSIKGVNTETEEGQQQMADNVEAVLGKNAVMAEVMKDLNQQGARAGIVFGLLSQNVDKLQEQLGIASDAYQKNIALQNEFNNMNETTAAKWARLKNEIEEAFVSDSMQRGLGWIIDRLRDIVDFITEDGLIAKGLKIIMSYLIALKLGIGSTIAGAGGALKNLGIAVMALANNLGIFTRATASARTEWKKMDAAMKANIWGAVIAAIGMVIYKIYDWIQATKEAAAEIGRFNEGLSKEKRALDDLFSPLEKGNLAQKERSRLITEINNKYGKYLGYMLSETTQATQLAEAHRSVALAIQEEALQKRILDQEERVRKKHAEDLNAAYGGIENAVRGAAKGEVNVQDITDSLKGFIDSNMGRILEANATRAFSSTAVGKELDQRIERLVNDGKLSRDAATDVYRAVADYAKEARSQTQEMQQATANSRADLRNTEREMVGTVNANINTLVSNLSNFGQRPQGTQTTQGKGVLAKPERQGLTAPQWGVQHNWQGDYGTKPNFQEPAEGWKPNIDKKNIEQVKRYVEAQDQLRGYLEANAGHIDEQTRKTAEMYLESEEEMKKLRDLLPKESGGNAGGGGGNSNPYGNFDRVNDPYSKWDADSLVNRRKEMLERVRSLANGADVQKVLSEDAKFISEAVRNNIKTTEQAIEWYNTERLKIQDALHEKYLTNTGDWMDPKKSKAAHKQFQNEMKVYLDELDAYYTERNQEIQTARNNEEITEAEAWRRTIDNETEWYNRRAELQKLYAEKSGEVTQAEQDAIYNIISERTGDEVKFIRQMIAKTIQFAKKIEKSGEKGAAIVHKWRADLDLDTEKDLLKSAKSFGKHLKFIEDTLAKERPYDGITKNLQENLDKMGILAAQYKRINDELLAQGKKAKYSDAQITAATYDEMAFFLEQAEHAWSIDIDELLRRMVQSGMVATAEEISKSEMLKQAVMGQLRKTFEEVQNAVKKEAAQIKKDVDILWNDETMGPGGTSMKSAYDKAIARLGMQQDSVSRANSFIGAGPASENVVTRLAAKQIEMQMHMQKAQYDMYRVQANQRIIALKKEAEEYRRLAALAEQENDATRKSLELLKAANAERDAANVKKSLGLTLAEETKKEEEKIAELKKLQEESQNRLYKDVKSYIDIVTSGLLKVFEAQNTGNEEYYNERAKLNLTGESGGAQQYIIIDNAGTEDAEAHYETLSELEYLERKHEIELENATREAWKAMLDELNMKINDTITDVVNSWYQDQATEANTRALEWNTQAVQNLTTTLGGSSSENNSSTAPAGGGTEGAGNTPLLGSLGSPSSSETTTTIITAPAAEGGSSGGTVGTGALSGQSMFPMTAEEVAQAQANIELLWQTYTEQGASAMIALAEQLGGMQNIVLPPWQMPEGGVEGALERIQQLWEAYAEYGIAAMQSMSDAMGEMENLPPDPTHLTEDGVNSAIGNASTLAMGQAQAQMDASKLATETIADNQQQLKTSTDSTNTQMTKSTQGMFAKMTQAMNLYGIAYQAMSNDNLDLEQKVAMIAVQSAGQAAMAGLSAAMSEGLGKIAMNTAETASKSTAQNGPILGPILFAMTSALIGGLTGLAVSKITKAKSDISSVTGASSSASVGKLTTGMLTYAEGNVNEFTDPGSLQTGRSYNVDAADGRTYRARYMGANPKTHITNGPEFHLAGERGREMIIDAGTTKQIVYNEPAVMKAIETLSVGGRLRRISSAPRRGRGVAAFADGNIEDFEEMANEQAAVANGTSINLEALQSSLDRQSDLLEDLRQNGIKAHFDVYGKGGLIDSYDTGKKFVSDRDWPY